MFQPLSMFSLFSSLIICIAFFSFVRTIYLTKLKKHRTPSFTMEDQLQLLYAEHIQLLQNNRFTLHKREDGVVLHTQNGAQSEILLSPQENWLHVRLSKEEHTLLSYEFHCRTRQIRDTSISNNRAFTSYDAHHLHSIQHLHIDLFQRHVPSKSLLR